MTIMPKKKIQHKGKQKHAVEESEFEVFGKKDENIEEEYTTVVDFETNKRYSKRSIESNWSKYDEDASDVRGEKDEFPKTNDLNYLLQIASSDCAHFEFREEKLWRNESNAAPASKIFNLDLDVLSSGLACLPFHERIGLPESELSAEDKQKFNEDADRNRQEYTSFREKLTKKAEDDPKPKDVGNMRELNESMKDKLYVGVGRGENEKTEPSEGAAEEESLSEVDFSDGKNSDKIEEKKQNKFFSENDENLEDWLDSVLDD